MTINLSSATVVQNLHDARVVWIMPATRHGNVDISLSCLAADLYMEACKGRIIRVMHFRIEQWRAWAPGLESADDWRRWRDAPLCLSAAAEQPLPQQGATQTVAAQPSAAQPDVSFLPAMQRRRLSHLARMAFQVAWPLADAHGEQLPLVFVSRHGETPRTLAIIKDLANDEALSPTQFSLSVHNAVIGLWSIMRGDTSEMTALAGENDGLEHGVLEACTLLGEGAPAVLLVVAEEQPPALYEPYIEDVPFSYAVALLLTPGDDWRLQLRNVDGPAAEWPHALNLLRALVGEQHLLQHHWKSRQWTWSRNKA